MNHLTQVLTTADVAGLFDVSTWTARRWACKGRLPAFQVAAPGPWRFLCDPVMSVLDAWNASDRSQPRESFVPPAPARPGPARYFDPVDTEEL